MTLPPNATGSGKTDFSEFETTNGGIWRISAVIDYATKYCLAITITPTSRGIDAVRCVQLAIDEAQRVLNLADLRTDRGTMDILDADDTIIGQSPAPIAIVSDNGPCYRGKDFQTLFTDQNDPLLRHVRTRVKSPQTNGVVERFFGNPQIRAPVPRLHRRRRRPRHGNPPIPHHLQHHPTPPGPRRPNPQTGLPRQPKPANFLTQDKRVSRRCAIICCG